MKSHVVRMMIAEAHQKQAQLLEIVKEIRAESTKPCRCVSDQAREEDPCGPCLARGVLGLAVQEPGNPACDSTQDTRETPAA